MHTLWEHLKKDRWFAVTLAFVVLGGIFLRTYEFHDWLRFSGDQARDAAIIDAAIEGTQPLPLIGPQAGGTNFALGPLHYYLSFASAKIFGAAPHTVAFPSWFFSVLVLPLFFMFLREAFARRIALMLTGLLGASYILVNASRYSSNQNLVPFFVLIFLWSILRILNDPKRFHPGWSIVLGVALGAGIQTHTFCLVVMPIVAVLAFLWMIRNKAAGAWKSFLLVLALTLAFNAGQISSELQTDFSNTRAFFHGVERDTNTDHAKNFFSLLACQAEANAHFVASVYDDNDCKDILDFSEDRWQTSYAFPLAAASLLFSVAGYILLVSRFRHERAQRRKNFLGLIILFQMLSFIFMVSVARYVHTVYFLLIFFVPFVLLGLLWERVELRYGTPGKKVVLAAFLLLLLCSLGRDLTMAHRYSVGLQDNDENSTLGQVERMSDYVLFHITPGTREVYFSGGRDLNKRFFEPIEYFVNRQGIAMESIAQVSRAELEPGVPLFFITDDPEKIEQPVGGSISGHEILSKAQFHNQTILILKNE